MPRTKGPKGPHSTLPLLLNTFIKLSYWEGLENVTLQKVAKEAGVAFNTVHYRFGGHTEGIVAAALTFIADHRARFIDETVSLKLENGEKHPLKSFLNAHLHWADKFKEQASFWLFALYTSSTHSRHSIEEALLKERLRIHRLVTESLGAGFYAPLAHLDVLAFKIQNALMAATTAKLIDKLRSPAEHANLCLESVEALVASHTKSRRKRNSG